MVDKEWCNTEHAIVGQPISWALSPSTTEEESYLLPALGNDGPMWLPPHLQTAARIAPNECASTSLRSVDCQQGRKATEKNTRKSKVYKNNFVLLC